ncbi:hypothetical protein F511_40869 [Dorcoceras hygrometricum]|uniref:Uncharacterized protein n=1 Tax=Dorcoceras hygrometricum TaxID=472368 RepID=A0A2Z7A539_9LAMI|nr:hypothetical protein F511_40869 [Dorcoceras hygrometricum]
MASSLFVNTIHICFDSVLAMDNQGMVAMFESLVATGLKGFLGCPAVLHEAALLEFFEMRKLTERFDGHDRTYRVLFNNVRNDMRDHKNLLSLDLKTYQYKVRNQVGAAAFDVVDVSRVVKELDAKVAAVATGMDDVRKDVETTKEAISHQIPDFRAQAQENYNILTAQLSELVAYVNLGGNDKKGEDSSSRGPQPPSDDQDRPTGEGSANREAGIREGVGRNRGGSGSSGSQSRGSGSGGDGVGDPDPPHG